MIPTLKMNKPDVEIAIARSFKKSISSLRFNDSQKFSCVDNDGQCVFFLQDEFIGVGRYRVIGRAKLWNSDKTMSRIYNLETNISVPENSSSPVITFPDVISAHLF